MLKTKRKFIILCVLFTTFLHVQTGAQEALDNQAIADINEIVTLRADASKIKGDGGTVVSTTTEFNVGDKIVFGLTIENISPRDIWIIYSVPIYLHPEIREVGSDEIQLYGIPAGHSHPRSEVKRVKAGQKESVPIFSSIQLYASGQEATLEEDGFQAHWDSSPGEYQVIFDLPIGIAFHEIPPDLVWDKAEWQGRLKSEGFGITIFE